MTAALNETGPLRRPRTYFMIAIITGPDFTFNPPNTEFFTLLLLYYHFTFTEAATRAKKLFYRLGLFLLLNFRNSTYLTDEFYFHLFWIYTNSYSKK